MLLFILMLFMLRDLLSVLKPTFLKILYFNWRIITLQYCSFFAIHQPESAMGAHVPHIPPHCIPLGCPRPPALSALLYASNLHWSSILHMIIYMFQCYSLKLSHPHLLSLSPKVYSFHLCLFCCLAYRIVITIFLNSTYIC